MLGNWLGDSEDCSEFVGQIQHFPLGVIFQALFFPRFFSCSEPLYFVSYFHIPSLFLLVLFMIKLLFQLSPISWATCFLFALQHTKSCRKHAPASNSFYCLLITRWPAITCLACWSALKYEGASLSTSCTKRH